MGEGSAEMHTSVGKIQREGGRERRAEGGLPLILKEKDCSKNGNNYMEKSSYVQLQTASCSGAISNKL